MAQVPVEHATLNVSVLAPVGEKWLHPESVVCCATAVFVPSELVGAKFDS